MKARCIQLPSPCGDTEIAATVSPSERYEKSRWRCAEWVRYLALGRRPEPIPSYTGVVEEPEAGKIGIACSGGGIRSAAFNLGALQALQEQGVLAKSRYLSGVSGGSYIAAAFCMVRKTWAPGRGRPAPGECGHDDSDPAVVDAAHPPFFPGSPEEQYLRNRASYMAPGLLGKVQLGYRFLLGLAFNLAFIGLFLVTVAVPLALLYGWIYPSLARHIDEKGKCGGAACNFAPLHIPDAVWVPIVALAGAALLLGLAAILAYRWTPTVRDVAETWSLRLLVLAAAAAALLIGVPVLLSLVRGWKEAVSQTTITPAEAAGVVSGSGVLTVGGAVLLHLRAEWTEVKKLEKQAEEAWKWYSGLAQRLRRALAYLIAALVGPALALALALVAMSAVLNLEHPWLRWVVCGAFAALFAIVYLLVDLTTWSPHPFYRRRLASAFALKRVSRAQEGTPPIAHEEAGVAVERDFHNLVKLSETAIERDARRRDCQWPTLLVCAAANISDDAATPPGRSVTSFTFSATAIGGPLVGAVPTKALEDSFGDDRRRVSTFTLPAAVAMSGAALSPSMGKMTKRPLRLLLGLANVRLGVWVPNPRRLKAFSDRRRVYPRPRPSYLLRELVGRSRVNARFLYVTDGGHYDNTGVMELLRRGCTEVHCFDASNDRFEAIGDLVALARSELDVEIDLDFSKLRPEPKTGLAEADCVTGTIRYPVKGAPAGRLHYARPVLTEDAPADALAYHQQDPRFPHDPTLDQLYTDQRFEAYRALGLRVARHRAAQAQAQARS
jgi:Patatin-like phospholipase